MGGSMFSADLSWTDECAETVGQRRERRLRGREHAGSTQSFQSDDSKSSFWSLPTRRKNNASKSPATKSISRKSSKLSLHDHSHSRPREDSLDSATGWSPPAQLPPSQFPIMPLLPSIEEPRHSTTRSSVRTVQHVEPDGHYRGKRIIEELEFHEIQQLSEGSYVSRTTTRSTETSSPSVYGRPEGSFPSQCTLDHGAASPAHLSPPNAGPKSTWEAPSDWDIASIRSSQNRQSLDSSFLCDPDSAELTQFQRSIRRMEHADPKLILARLKDDPAPGVLATDPYAEEELAVEKHLWCLTALQLQNMENSLVPNQGVGPLLGLPTLFRQPKRVLELYSNMAEVYQLSAIYPKSHISYLTVRQPLASIPIPANIHPLTVPSAGMLPFPYPSDSFNHIRCATLPSHVPSSKMQPVLRDLLRMLAPGGILELRLVDSTPVRATMGPRLRAWFEDHLMLNLEKEFLCSRPLALFPIWVKDCGLRVLEGGNTGNDLVIQRLQLPACARPTGTESKHSSYYSARSHSSTKRNTLEYNIQKALASSGTEALDFAALSEEPSKDAPAAVEGDLAALDAEMAALVARGLWKDSWGSLVDRGSTMGHDVIWWWDDPEIVRECWDYSTVFECGTMFAFKE
ncbi:hypothetical protein BFW01_g10436 [Lasiodiplodia theobromae]|uniref:Uncharacterized protein n=1 Tax=Lasiodiplodia theobromae TaxID=45133 RepID=A0A8H7IP33_9PEZI|nr:hypothetical protein BFW01_g10436 [Lasiodiplodia theobromae]